MRSMRNVKSPRGTVHYAVVPPAWTPNVNDLHDMVAGGTGWIRLRRASEQKTRGCAEGHHCQPAITTHNVASSFLLCVQRALPILCANMHSPLWPLTVHHGMPFAAGSENFGIDRVQRHFVP